MNENQNINVNEETVETTEQVENEKIYSKAEVAEMELSHQGGLSEKINRIVATQDSKEIIELFKDLIVKSYGVVSDDGRRFIKNDQLREEFVQTEAYSELFMELASDADEAAKFVNGIIPQIENKKQV